MKNLFVLIFLGTLLVCQGQEHKHKKEHAPGKANEYMHQSSVEDLAERLNHRNGMPIKNPKKYLPSWGISQERKSWISVRDPDIFQ